MVMWHINDRGCRKKGPFMTPILKEDAAELDYGNMPLEEMLVIAKENGVRAIVLETHKAGRCMLLQKQMRNYL